MHFSATMLVIPEDLCQLLVPDRIETSAGKPSLHEEDRLIERTLNCPDCFQVTNLVADTPADFTCSSCGYNLFSYYYEGWSAFAADKYIEHEVRRLTSIAIKKGRDAFKKRQAKREQAEKKKKDGLNGGFNAWLADGREILDFFKRNDLKCTWCGGKNLKFLHGEKRRQRYMHSTKDGGRDRRYKVNPKLTTYWSYQRCNDCSAQSVYLHEASESPSVKAPIWKAECTEPGKTKRTAANYNLDEE